MTAPTPRPEPRTYCCELAEFGDICSCADDFAEVLAAFASPLVLVHEDGTWRWER